MNRNHFYLYTVDVRRIETENGAKVIHWDEAQAIACNIHEVAGKLKKPLDDIRYRHKDILKGDHQTMTIKSNGELDADFIKKQITLPETPARSVPDKRLTTDRKQNEAPLELEMPVIDAAQGRLF